MIHMHHTLFMCCRVQVQEKSADDRTVENSSKVKAQVAKVSNEFYYYYCVNGINDIYKAA